MTSDVTSRWIWGLPCVVLLIYGVALRWPTLDVPGNFASGRLAYSDVIVFYMADNPVPYLERDIEYPVLTGLTIWVTGCMPDGKHGYFIANALILSVALLGCFALLVIAGPDVRLSHFALAPGLAFYSVLNWDALGVLGMVAAVFYARRRRFDLAGASLSLGACAKLFPGFLLPVLWAYAIQSSEGQIEDRRAGRWKEFFLCPNVRQLLIGFASVALALNLPVMILNFKGWSYFLRFQSGRTHNLDSIWHYLPPIPDQAESLIFAIVFLGGIVWVTLCVLDGARWEIAALLSLVFFLLASKVYSPQYDLWLLPLLALTACPLWLWITYVLADLFYYWAIFTFHYVATGGESRLDANTMSVLLGASTWSREIALAALLIWGLKNLSLTLDKKRNSAFRPNRPAIEGKGSASIVRRTHDGTVFRRRTCPS